MGWMSRLPNSNDPPEGSFEYGPQEPHDDLSVLLNGLGKRCAGCKRVTMNYYLDVQGKCPECRGATARKDQ